MKKIVLSMIAFLTFAGSALAYDPPVKNDYKYDVRRVKYNANIEEVRTQDNKYESTATRPLGYNKDALVTYTDGKVYISLADANLHVPTDLGVFWAEVSGSSSASGVSVYDPAKTYDINIVTVGADHKIYVSKQGGNTGHALTEDTWWNNISGSGATAQDDEWVVTETYKSGKLVSHGDTAYISKQDANVGHQVTEVAWWTKVDGGLDNARLWAPNHTYHANEIFFFEGINGAVEAVGKKLKAPHGYLGRYMADYTTPAVLNEAEMAKIYTISNGGSLFRDPVATIADLKAIDNPSDGETRQVLSYAPDMVFYTYNAHARSGVTPNSLTDTGKWNVPNASNTILNIGRHGVATASESYATGPPANAFDGDLLINGWGNNDHLPVDLIYTFDKPRDLYGYSFKRSSSQTGGWTNTNYSPKTWKLYGQLEGQTTWTEIDSQTKQYIQQDVAKSEYVIPANHTKYKAIKWTITESVNGTWVNLTEVEIFSKGASIKTEQSAFGAFLGTANTFATLPVVSAAGHAAKESDTAVLVADEVGNGTVGNPQYKQGVYIYDDNNVFEFGYGVVGNILELTDAQALDVVEVTKGLMSPKQITALAHQEIAERAVKYFTNEANASAEPIHPKQIFFIQSLGGFMNNGLATITPFSTSHPEIVPVASGTFGGETITFSANKALVHGTARVISAAPTADNLTLTIPTDYGYYLISNVGQYGFLVAQSGGQAVIGVTPGQTIQVGRSVDGTYHGTLISDLVGSGLRGSPVANEAALAELLAKPYGKRLVKSTGREYVFKRTVDLTTPESTSLLNIADAAATGKWVLQNQGGSHPPQVISLDIAGGATANATFAVPNPSEIVVNVRVFSHIEIPVSFDFFRLKTKGYISKTYAGLNDTGNDDTLLELNKGVVTLTYIDDSNIRIDYTLAGYSKGNTWNRRHGTVGSYSISDLIVYYTPVIPAQTPEKTDAQIKTAYENNPNTNVFNDLQLAKLEDIAGIPDAVYAKDFPGADIGAKVNAAITSIGNNGTVLVGRDDWCGKSFNTTIQMAGEGIVVNGPGWRCKATYTGTGSAVRFHGTNGTQFNNFRISGAGNANPAVDGLYFDDGFNNDKLDLIFLEHFSGDGFDFENKTAGSYAYHPVVTHSKITDADGFPVYIHQTGNNGHVNGVHFEDLIITGVEPGKQAINQTSGMGHTFNMLYVQSGGAGSYLAAVNPNHHWFGSTFTNVSNELEGGIQLQSAGYVKGLDVQGGIKIMPGVDLDNASWHVTDRYGKLNASTIESKVFIGDGVVQGGFFNGQDGGAVVSNVTTMTDGSFTAKVKFNLHELPSAIKVILSKKAGITTATPGWWMYVNTTGVVSINLSDGTHARTATLDTVALDKFYYIDIRYDATAHVLTGYINGKKTATNDTATITDSIANTEAITIGGLPSNTRVPLASIADVDVRQGATIIYKNDVPVKVVAGAGGGTDNTLAAGVNAITLSGQVLGTHDTIEKIVDTAPVAGGIFGYDVNGMFEVKTSISVDVFLGAGVNTAYSLGHNGDNLTMRNGANTATLEFIAGGGGSLYVAKPAHSDSPCVAGSRATDVITHFNYECGPADDWNYRDASGQWIDWNDPTNPPAGGATVSITSQTTAHDSNIRSLNGTATLMQSFTVDASSTLTEVVLWQHMVGATTGNVTVRIDDDLDMSTEFLETITVAVDNVEGAKTFTLPSSVALSAGTTYYIGIQGSADYDDRTATFGNTSNPYANGGRYNGSSWDLSSATIDASRDLYFDIRGTQP